MRPLRHWERDFELVEELGIRFLRYGPPLHRTFLGPGRYDWEFADLTFAELKARDIVPIVDLCHFGVPDWIGNFQNPDFPALFAEYAARLRRSASPGCSSTRRSTRCSSAPPSRPRYGWWNEQLHERPRLRHRAQAHRARPTCWRCRRSSRSGPTRSSSRASRSEYFHAENPHADQAGRDPATRERFLSLDLNYGRRVDSEMYEYLLDNGMTRDEYHFFLDHNLQATTASWATTTTSPTSTSWRRTAHAEPSGEVFGYDEITRQYYDRYRLPVMHTETNIDRGPERRRGRRLALEGMGQRAARAQRRRADRRLHLVLADRPGRLGHRSARDSAAR